MIADIITENEITPRLVASMPTRPTAPVAFGGKGYTAKDMKDAFDALSLLIIERFNALILDIREGRICEAVPTGLEGLSTLAELISGIESGALAGKNQICRHLPFAVFSAASSGCGQALRG